MSAATQALGVKEVLATVKRLRERGVVGRPLTKSSNPWKTRKVPFSPELERIAGIPRRDWEKEAEELQLAERLTELLRTEEGTQQLYAIQAYVLRELWALGGAIAILRVGGGKSLITFLAAYVVEAFRPLLLVPGALLEKTEIHMKKDAYNWRIPHFIRVESYEKIANPNNIGLLHEFKPDLIMLDEATRCKNSSSVAARQIHYFIEDAKRGYCRVEVNKKIVKRPFKAEKPKMLALSGTLTVRSVLDYWHIMKWILPHMNLPLPRTFPEVMQWALCLDSKVKDLHRVKPGALLELCNAKERKIAKTDPLKAARQAYRRRLLQTPGIVCSSQPFFGVSLRVEALQVQPPEPIIEAFKKLRKWKAPDGMELQDAHIAAMRARQVALGFYYRPNPKPPREYVEAQKDWGRACRWVISRNRRRLDSEGQVVQAIKRGLYPEAAEAWEVWEAWNKEFTPGTEVVWIHDYAIKYAAKWMQKKENRRGIVWYSDVAFGEKLEEYTGISRYGEQSRDKNGRFIENHPHDTPMIASIGANYMGKNLQYGWSRNLLMSGTISNGEWMEQWLGRTHREHQTDDEVVAQLFIPSIEFLRAFWSAYEDNEFEDDMESARKLMYCDVVVPELHAVRTKHGALWKESKLGEDDGPDRRRNHRVLH